MKDISKTAFIFLRLKAYVLHYLKCIKPQTVRVIIFAQGRTGSSLLESLISSTGHFKKRGELLGESGTAVEFPYQYISGLSKLFRKENFIFHLKIYHLLEDRNKQVDPSVFLRKLQEDGWKIIYLKRKNKLNQAMSNLIAARTGVYHKYSEIRVPIRFEVDIDSITKRIEKRLEYDKMEAEVLSNLNYYQVVYEEDLEKSEYHQTTVNNILSYLSLEKREAKTKLLKINTFSHKELVANYHELYKLLKEKEWLGYLDYKK